jgi:hypothetical protein
VRPQGGRGVRERGDAPLNSVEGFVRQWIGWREFIRGVYWVQGEDYPDRNGLDHEHDLPEFFWDADTDMNCMRDCLGQVRDHAYAHHIPRLMVMGNFAMLAGVHARKVADWYLAMFVDAVDWASNPNTIGHEPARRPRGRGHQALRGEREVHRADEQLLQTAGTTRGRRRARPPARSTRSTGTSCCGTPTVSARTDGWR